MRSKMNFIMKIISKYFGLLANMTKIEVFFYILNMNNMLIFTLKLDYFCLCLKINKFVEIILKIKTIFYK